MGKYCTKGKAEDCQDGQYNPNFGQSECLPCENGYLCNDKTKMEPCPVEGYCIANIFTVCPDGTYRNLELGASTNDCFSCPTGKYCQNGKIQGDCSDGYFCTKGADSATPTNDREFANICPRGHYCKSGKYHPCPVGTYNPDEGKFDKDLHCLPCDNCPYEGMTSNADCPAGYTCENGDKELCPKGYFCEEGVNKTQCLAGTWSDVEGNKADSDCYACVEGFFCDGLSLLDNYSAVTSNPCPAGNYCPEGATAGQPCPAGYRCPEGSSYYLECEPYQYSNSGQSFCTPCEAKFGCYYEDTDFPRKSVRVDCPIGYYCPNEGSPEAVNTNRTLPCPFGQVGASTGLDNITDCTSCPAGQYCAYPATTSDSIETCGPGSYCNSGAFSEHPSKCASQGSAIGQVDGNICPQGSFCLDGFETVCQDDFFTGTVGNSECLICPAGKLCRSGNLTECPTGQYCDGTLNDCPSGTYNDYTSAQQEADCIDCPAGYYCENEGMADPTAAQPCLKGYYCEGGNTRGDEFACTFGDYCEEAS